MYESVPLGRSYPTPGCMDGPLVAASTAAPVGAAGPGPGWSTPMVSPGATGAGVGAAMGAAGVHGLPLVLRHADGSWEVGDQAAQLLSGLHGHVAVVAIAGSTCRGRGM